MLTGRLVAAVHQIKTINEAKSGLYDSQYQEQTRSCQRDQHSLFSQYQVSAYLFLPLTLVIFFVSSWPE